jgi:hypothetical protein
MSDFAVAIIVVAVTYAVPLSIMIRVMYLKAVDRGAKAMIKALLSSARKDGDPYVSLELLEKLLKNWENDK